MCLTVANETGRKGGGGGGGGCEEKDKEYQKNKKNGEKHPTETSSQRGKRHFFSFSISAIRAEKHTIYSHTHTQKNVTLSKKSRKNQIFSPPHVIFLYKSNDIKQPWPVIKSQKKQSQ